MRPDPGESPQRIVEEVERRLGLRFHARRTHAIHSALRQMLAGAESDFSDAVIRALVEGEYDHAALRTLLATVTVNETYLFRDPGFFDALRSVILPPLIARRRRANRRLSLWSAACATGEEAYSLAAVLHRLLPDIDSWRVDVVASDVNPDSLDQARIGNYGAWSVREGVPPVYGHYFPQVRERTVVAAALRERISFVQHNLLDRRLPRRIAAAAPFDIIVCRNVLMYMRDDAVTAIVEQLYAQLADGGWLIVAPSEVTDAAFASFEYHLVGHVHLLRKPDPAARGGRGVREAPEQPGITARGPARGIDYAPDLNADLATAGFRAVDTAADEVPVTTDQAHRAVAATGPEAPRVRLDRDELLTLALRSADAGELDSALVNCNAAIALDPLATDARLLKVMVLEEAHDYAAAVRESESIIYLDRGEISAHLAIARNAGRCGMGELATRHRNAASRLQRTMAPGEAQSGGGGGSSAMPLRGEVQRT